MLFNAGFDVFTPMQEVLLTEKGKRIRTSRPFIQDLLFVHSDRQHLDPVILKTPTIQYRFAKGLGYMEPMTVPDAAMEDFIRAVNASSAPVFLRPSEVGTSSIGKQVRIVGGPLDGMEGKLIRIGSTRVKRIYVEIPNLIAAAVEVSPEFIEILHS